MSLLSNVVVIFLSSILVLSPNGPFLDLPLLHSVSDFDRRFHYNIAASHFLSIRLSHAVFLELSTRFFMVKQFALPALHMLAQRARSTPHHHTSCCLCRHLRILPGVSSRLFHHCVRKAGSALTKYKFAPRHNSEICNWGSTISSTSSISSVYNVAAELWLQFMAQVMFFPC